MVAAVAAAAAPVVLVGDSVIDADASGALSSPNSLSLTAREGVAGVERSAVAQPALLIKRFASRDTRFIHLVPLPELTLYVPSKSKVLSGGADNS